MSDQVDIFNQEQTSAKLQGIIDALNNLQLQLDYERQKIVDALGGEPALWSDDGPGSPGGVLFRSLTQPGIVEANSNFTSDMAGNIGVAGTLKVGTGPAIAGATMQVDGPLVISDGAGGAVASISQSGIFGGQTSGVGKLKITSVTASVPTVVATVGSGGVSWQDAYIVSINIIGTGAIGNVTRIVQTAYTIINTAILGADTLYGIAATVAVSNVNNNSYTVTVTTDKNCTCYTNVTRVSRYPGGIPVWTLS